MIGGDEEVFTQLEPAIATLAPTGGYLYCGPSGAGHFVKMVHNGIEYGMLEAYGEKVFRYYERLSLCWRTQLFEGCSSVEPRERSPLMAPGAC